MAGDWQEVVCPFCGEADFDHVGLKLHLQRWCEAYDSLSTADRTTVHDAANREGATP